MQSIPSDDIILYYADIVEWYKDGSLQLMVAILIHLMTNCLCIFCATHLHACVSLYATEVEQCDK